MTHDLDGSSSQSSSADIGEPQTPSPLTSQAQAIKVQDDTLSSIADPQLARLLNNLSISAQAVYSSTAKVDTVAPVVPIPIPQTSVANDYIDNSSDTIKSDPGHELPAIPIPTDDSASHPSQPVQASSTPRGGQGPQLARSPPLHNNDRPHPVFVQSEVAASPSTGVSPEASERHAKRLALLESITNEPLMSSTPLVVPPVQMDHTRQTLQPWIQPPYPMFTHPGLSPSVPPSDRNPQPHFFPFAPRDHGLMHPGATIRPPVMNGGVNPAFIRPRTSNSVFPPSVPMHPYPGHSLSMNQSQLLSLLGPHTVHPPPPGSFPPNVHGSTPAIPQFVKQPNAFPVASSTPVPLQHNVIPQSAPPTSPHFSSRHIPNKVNLLSILNANPAHPTDTTRTPHPPFGNALPYHVLNGNMHR